MPQHLVKATMLAPFTSNALRVLRVEEESRLLKINSIVQTIYPLVLNIAKYSNDTSYYHEIKFADRIFYTANMHYILKGLKELFPDADIAHTLLTPGDDGKIHDVAKLDNTTLPHVSKVYENSYIVIDWS